MSCHNHIDLADKQKRDQQESKSGRLVSVGEYLANTPRLVLTMLDLMEKGVEHAPK